MSAAGGSEVESLLGALAASVPGASGRSQAARELAEVIAKRVSLDRESAEVAADAVALHELGKLYLDPTLVPFPTAGADREAQREYEQHYELGRALAEGAGLPKRVCAAILHQRERWDGEGPQGLSAEEIPVAARVTAVCAEFVLARTRSAEEAEGDQRAAVTERIESLAGSRLDPKLARAAIQAVEAGEVPAGPEQHDESGTKAAEGDAAPGSAES